MLESDSKKKWTCGIRCPAGTCSGLYINEFYYYNISKIFLSLDQGIQSAELKKDIAKCPDWHWMKKQLIFFSYQKLNNLFRGWNGGVNSWLVFLQNIRLQLLTWFPYIQELIKKSYYTFLLCNPWRRLLNLYKKLSGIFLEGDNFGDECCVGWKSLLHLETLSDIIILWTFSSRD